MTEHEITTLLDRFVERFEGEVGDWDDVLERAAEHAAVAPHRSRRLRLVTARRGRSVLLFAAAGMGTALVLLAATTPWRGGPSVLDRAAAAIASPGSAKILYERITIHGTPTLPPGRSPSQLPPGFPHPPYSLLAHVNVWMSDASPYRFRLTEDGVTSGLLHGRRVKVGGQPTEIGSTLGSTQGLSYDLTHRALTPVTFPSPPKRVQLDVANFIWQALTSGRAKVDGTAVLHGRSVVRIRLLADVYGRLQTVALYFADATTYRPLRVEIDARNEPLSQQAIPGFPLLYLTSIQMSSLPGMLGRYVLDFDAYRHLAPTPGNEKLTSIHAAHPRAKTI